MLRITILGLSHCDVEIKECIIVDVNHQNMEHTKYFAQLNTIFSNVVKYMLYDPIVLSSCYRICITVSKL
jgi:hypothetical protein